MLNRGKESPVGLPAVRHPFELFSRYSYRMIIKSEITESYKTASKNFTNRKIGDIIYNV